MVQQERGRTRDVDADHVAVRGQPLEERDRIVAGTPGAPRAWTGPDPAAASPSPWRHHLRPRARPQPVGSRMRSLPDGYAIRPASLERPRRGRRDAAGRRPRRHGPVRLRRRLPPRPVVLTGARPVGRRVGRDGSEVDDRRPRQRRPRGRRQAQVVGPRASGPPWPRDRLGVARPDRDARGERIEPGSDPSSRRSPTSTRRGPRWSVPEGSNACGRSGTSSSTSTDHRPNPAGPHRASRSAGHRTRARPAHGPRDLRRGVPRGVGLPRDPVRGVVEPSRSETTSYDPSLWLLATDGDEAVGALSGVVWGDRGWVGELGVRKPWRGRGIASALLRRAFATFASRDLPRVMLNVDAANPTGAVRLYERAGHAHGPRLGRVREARGLTRGGRGSVSEASSRRSRHHLSVSGRGPARPPRSSARTGRRAPPGAARVLPHRRGHPRTDRGSPRKIVVVASLHRGQPLSETGERERVIADRADVVLSLPGHVRARCTRARGRVDHAPAEDVVRHRRRGDEEVPGDRFGRACSRPAEHEPEPWPGGTEPSRRASSRDPAAARPAAGTRGRWSATRRARRGVTASNSSTSVRVQSSSTSASRIPSAMPKVRSRSETRSPPSTASEPTMAPATTRSSRAPSPSTRSRRSSRCPP